MRRVKFLLCFIIIIFTSSAFAVNSNYKDSNFNFSDLNSISLYYISYQSVFNDKTNNYIKFDKPEPIILKFLNNKSVLNKTSFYIYGKQKTQANLVINIYFIGNFNESAFADIEFILYDCYNKNIIYRNRFIEEKTCTCEELINYICSKFMFEIKT